MGDTKFGVSVGIASTVLFLLAVVDFLPALIFAGYIILFEESDDFKKAAYNLTAIIVIFGLLFGALDILDNILGIIGALFSRMPSWVTTLSNLFGIIRNIGRIARTVIFIAMAFGVRTSKGVPSYMVKHGRTVAAEPAAGLQFCSRCGTAVPAGAKFCDKCGSSMNGRQG